MPGGDASSRSHGGRRVTLQDVARQSGVSTMTVSRVVRGLDKRVTEETARHVRAVIAKLGYQPDMVAKSLRGDSTRTIGLMLSSFGGFFFSSCARAIDEVAQAHGYSVILAGSHESIESERSQFEMLMIRRIEGLLTIPTPGSHQFLKHALADGFPIVSLEREIPHLSLDTVVVENRIGAKKAVEHLLQHGHRRIACVANKSQLYTVSERIKGYREAMRESGAKPLLVEGPDEEQMRPALREALRVRNAPTALFTTNNVVSLQVLPILAERGLRIPGDMALVGFDDFSAAPYLQPPLTTVRQPAAEVGSRAAELLFKRILEARGGKSCKIVLPTELIVRRSCGCCEEGRSECEASGGNIR